jgi:hypothetical protein
MPPRLRRRSCGAARAQTTQRLEQIVRPGSGADQLGRAANQQDHAKRFPQPPPARGAVRQPFESAEIDRASDRERTAHQHDPHAIENARQHPDRQAQEGHAEHGLDRVHPGAGARQQFAGTGSEHDQWCAHAEGERKQSGTAEHRIVRLCNVNDGGGQRRRHARSDDQRRQRTHDRDAVSEPPDCVLLTFAIFDCQELGSCSS